MRRLVLALVVSSVSVSTDAQTAPTSSDPVAIAISQKAIAGLTGGTPVSDVTLSANITASLGSAPEVGTGQLVASTNGSRLDLNLPSVTRSEVRYTSNGFASGAWSLNGAAATPSANHNCRTDAAWFFPALSSLLQTSNPQYTFKYIATEQRAGRSVYHIQVFQPSPGAPIAFQQLSASEFYVDSANFLPIAIAFNTHPDNDAGKNIPVEVDFSNYQSYSGVLIPMRVQKSQWGSLLLDIQVSAVSLNTGVPVSTFSLN